MTSDDARRSQEAHRAWLLDLMKDAARAEADFRRAADDKRALYARLALAVAGIDRCLDALLREPMEVDRADGA